jgi:Oligosaccharide biosynthesis protein Alg14 like
MRKQKVLAVASAGGHWVQLLRLRSAFERHNALYMSTNPDLARETAGARYVLVRDANMGDKIALLILASQVLLVIVRERPDVVVTTGAAPGFFALVIGKMFRAKTIWIDSIANAEELSLAGRKVRHWADHWLTQWPALAKKDGPRYLGSVL